MKYTKQGVLEKNSLRFIMFRKLSSVERNAGGIPVEFTDDANKLNLTQLYSTGQPQVGRLT